MILNRRELITKSLSGAGALAAGTLLQGACRSVRQTGVRLEERDRFGGCPQIRFERSGFFRLEKTDRWWLVTPDGSAFLSWGLNHVAPHLLRQDVNRAYWLEKFGTTDDRSEAFLDGFRGKVAADMQAFGFNTLGTHSSTRWYPRGSYPYVCQTRFLELSHWQDPEDEAFLDVFSESFERHCQSMVEQRARPNADDPWLIGYSFVDCPIFTERDAAPRENNLYGARRPRRLATWPRILRNLPGDQPGKEAYVRLMRKRYEEDIARFSDVYGVDFGSWESLSRATDWRPDPDLTNSREDEDNHAFLKATIEQYYRVATGAIRKVDRNHLILGDKMNGNTDTPEDIIAIAGRHMDLIFYQTFGLYPSQKAHLDRWARVVSRPFLNGDSAYSVPTENMPDPYGPHCKDQQERARVSLEFSESAFRRPDFVGWNHCGWVDGWTSFPRQEFKQHQGLQTPFGDVHQPMLEAFSTFSRRMYDVANG